MKYDKLSLSHVFVSTADSKKQILTDVSLSFDPRDMTVIMGPNGSGKSTFAGAVMGSSEYVTQGVIKLGSTRLSTYPTEKRAKLGIFLAFQTPVAISGISVVNLLRVAVKESRPSVDVMALTKDIMATAEELRIDPQLLTRSIHEGFSGGERKKIELLQALILRPKFAIFDEIDTGLDVDALQIVAQGVAKLQAQGTGCIVITHYQRLLSHLHPNRVIVFKKGNVDQIGGPELAAHIERFGYEG